MSRDHKIAKEMLGYISLVPPAPIPDLIAEAIQIGLLDPIFLAIGGSAYALTIEGIRFLYRNIIPTREELLKRDRGQYPLSGAPEPPPWARYDPEDAVLELDFKNKQGSVISTYAYCGVKMEVYRSFLCSSNRARFFASSIRNDFPAVKLFPCEDQKS